MARLSIRQVRHPIQENNLGGACPETNYKASHDWEAKSYGYICCRCGWIHIESDDKK